MKGTIKNGCTVTLSGSDAWDAQRKGEVAQHLQNGGRLAATLYDLSVFPEALRDRLDSIITDAASKLKVKGYKTRIVAGASKSGRHVSSSGKTYGVMRNPLTVNWELIEAAEEKTASNDVVNSLLEDLGLGAAKDEPETPSADDVLAELNG